MIRLANVYILPISSKLLLSFCYFLQMTQHQSGTQQAYALMNPKVLIYI
ncbi:hypothetical protein [Candidatus Cardinium sp. cBcalN2]|nr:hypothetical protein [Candidatus Cardinium sp. cBcalN2]